MCLSVCGIDLAVRKKRCTGYALIVIYGDSDAELTRLNCLHGVEEVMDEVVRDHVSVAAVDAPISGGGRIREVEREMWRRGFKVLPPSMPWMRELTKLGEALASNLRRLGVEVIETHPSSALRSSGAGSVPELLSMLGVKFPKDYLPKIASSRDLRDAVIAAAVAYCYVTGCVEPVEANGDVIYLIRELSPLKG